MNFITDLSSSKWKEVMYDSILVIVNHYIKMTRYLFTKKILTVIKLTKLFFKQIALRYEISNNIIIDKDSLFINAFWSKICYHVKNWMMTKHHFLFANRWLNRIIKSNVETLSKSVLFQKVKWLSYASTHSWVHLSSDEACFVEL